jgi:hypothetical protein
VSSSRENQTYFVKKVEKSKTFEKFESLQKIPNSNGLSCTTPNAHLSILSTPPPFPPFSLGAHTTFPCLSLK